MNANIYPGRETPPDWNNIDVLQRDRLPARANLVVFPDLTSCRQAITDHRRYLTPYIQLLDEWELRSYADILQLPESILSFRSGFEPAEVPGGQAVEVDEFALPGGYPFPVTPPLVPAQQPVLVYRHIGQTPPDWTSLRKRIVLQGVAAACHVFVNARLVGYTQGTGLPAEFDITHALHDGDNEIFILVYPHCSGSYLEKPSTGVLGLIREVWLEAVPLITLQDVGVRTSAVPDGSWQLDLSVSLLSWRAALDSPTVRLSLWQGEQCLYESRWTVPLQTAVDQTFGSPVQAIGQLTAQALLETVEPWNDEHPVLYDLYIEVDDPAGRALACAHQAVGFREVRCQAGRLFLNGQPVPLRAAIWPATIGGELTGIAIREMIATLRHLKQSHLNALYIRDIPADPILLDLCDIYGVLVIDEAPLDISHAALQIALREDPRWRALALDRLERLVRRDCNHPSVVLWSAGLFRQSSAFTVQLTEALRLWDDSRPIHLVDLADLSFEIDARQAGGFGFSEQTPWLTDPNGPGQCYLVLDDQAAVLLRELRQLLRPLEIVALDALGGTFTLKNHLRWTSARQFRVDWLLLCNGTMILNGEIDSIGCQPGQEQFIRLDYGAQAFDDGNEYLLRFELIYTDDLLWAACGDEAFFCEFILAPAARPDLAAPSPAGGKLRLESDRHNLIVSGARFWLIINRINGALESWRVGDKELLASRIQTSGQAAMGLQPEVWRQPDFFDTLWLPEWQQAGLDRLMPQVIACQPTCDGQTAEIEMVISYAATGQPACLEIVNRYDIRAAGDLRVFTRVQLLDDKLPPLPCLGLSLNLNRQLDDIQWFGSGPEHGLASQHASCRRGLYEGWEADPAQGIRLPGDQPGLYPDTDWLSCKTPNGTGLIISGSELFGFALTPVGQGLWPGSDEAGELERKALRLQLFAQALPFEEEPVSEAGWHFAPFGGK